MLRSSIPGRTSDIGDSKRCNFFVDMLRSSLKEEKELEDLLPIAEEEAKSVKLKNILAGYLTQVHKQAIRAEEIFGILLMQPGGDSLRSVKNLVKEIRILEHALHTNSVNDTELRTSIQRIIRNKIVLYSNLQQLAVSLGMDDSTVLLSQSLLDEKESDLLLSEMFTATTGQFIEV